MFLCCHVLFCVQVKVPGRDRSEDGLSDIARKQQTVREKQTDTDVESKFGVCLCHPALIN